jgi:hypothetical protein
MIGARAISHDRLLILVVVILTGRLWFVPGRGTGWLEVIRLSLPPVTKKHLLPGITILPVILGRAYVKAIYVLYIF